MSSKETSRWLVFSLVAMVCAWLLACGSAPQPPAQESKAATAEPRLAVQAAASPISVPSLQAPAEQVATRESAKSPPPNPEDIKGAIGRVFQKAATADTLHPQESFLVGDFNGDGSEDLAVVVKPSDGGLGEINSEVANWTLQDPVKVAVPGASAPRQSIANKRVLAEKGKTLLAIIHGVGPGGWRSSEAKQTYLLKNVAGSDMVVQRLATLRAGKDRRRLPPLRGDAIQETIAGKPGLLFWTGAGYAWHTRQSQPEPEIH